MKKVLNLTQHQATQEQIKDGVIDLRPELQRELKHLLNFGVPPTTKEIMDRVNAIYRIVVEEITGKRIGDENYDKVINEAIDGVMVGGAMWLIPALVEDLQNATTVYASFSQRVSEEHVNENGEVIKTSRFKHIKLVEIPL